MTRDEALAALKQGHLEEIKHLRMVLASGLAGPVSTHAEHLELFRKGLAVARMTDEKASPIIAELFKE